MIQANKDEFMQIWDRSIDFKAKATLIFCVFSDVGSKRWRLYSLLHTAKKHLNHLIWDLFSSPTLESTQWWTDDSSLRAGLM